MSQDREFTFVCLKDGERVKAKLGDLKQTAMITNMCSNGYGGEVPVEIDSKNFKEIVAYCQYHTKNPDKEVKDDPTYVSPWDKRFIEKFMDKKTAHKALLELYFYADYLDIPDILALVAKTMVNLMNDAKTADKFREELGI